MIEIIEWFRRAIPNPSIENQMVQFGCHLEEVGEMLKAVRIYSKEIEVFEEDFKDKSEPFKEIFSSMSDDEKLDLLDSLCDQIVTAIGVGYMLGFDIKNALDEVNRSNWSKFNEFGEPIFGENGKIIKGHAYFKPNLNKFI